MFSFCQSTAPELVDVRNFTLKLICRLFCSNQCEVPLALGYLAHVIRILASALQSGVQSTISVLLQHTKFIFSLDYRGLLVLVPLYLQQITIVLKPNSDFSHKAQSAAISILGSLLCLPDFYDKYDVPVLGKSERMTMAQVKDTVVREIDQVLTASATIHSDDKTYLRVVSKAICCATVLTYQEAIKDNCNLEMLKVILRSRG